MGHSSSSVKKPARDSSLKRYERSVERGLKRRLRFEANKENYSVVTQGTQDETIDTALNDSFADIEVL